MRYRVITFRKLVHTVIKYYMTAETDAEQLSPTTHATRHRKHVTEEVTFVPVSICEHLTCLELRTFLCVCVAHSYLLLSYCRLWLEDELLQLMSLSHEPWRHTQKQTVTGNNAILDLSSMPFLLFLLTHNCGCIKPDLSAAPFQKMRFSFLVFFFFGTH